MTYERAAVVAAVALMAAGHEGLKYTPYYDPPGILTVCYGHTGPDVVRGRMYSRDECEQFLVGDAREAVLTVERCAPGLPMRATIAFADAVFNLGPRIVCDQSVSKAARLLASGYWREACKELPKWNKARVFGVLTELHGLTKRRAEELQMCLSGGEK